MPTIPSRPHEVPASEGKSHFLPGKERVVPGKKVPSSQESTKEATTPHVQVASRVLNQPPAEKATRKIFRQKNKHLKRGKMPKIN